MAKAVAQAQGAVSLYPGNGPSSMSSNVIYERNVTYGTRLNRDYSAASAAA
jgi:hypothetical protein